MIHSFQKKAQSVIFREGWGMTETGPSVCQTHDETFKPGSCGYLLPNTEAKIMCLEKGLPLGPNERGELCVRGPQVNLVLCQLKLKSRLYYISIRKRKRIFIYILIILGDERLFK